MRPPMLLAFDLDGTLIAEGGHEVPPHSAEALQRLRGLGVLIALITGRDLAPATVVASAQPHAVATNNGGTVHMTGQPQTEYHLSHTDVQDVLAHKLGDTSTIVYTEMIVYADAPANKPIPDWLRQRIVKPLHTIPTDAKILKVSFFHPEIRMWRETLTETHPHLVMTGAHEPYPHFLSVTPKGADKGAALITIAQALGVDMTRTTAFGDSDNDVAMLECVSISSKIRG